MIQFPNAKINIGLNVVEKRSDGYHNLETVFYPIPLCDALEIIINKNLETEYELFNSGIKVDAAAGSNICVKALNLIKKDYHIPPIEIHLHKAIPFGAGLGGGSSDAAFMLNMLNSMFDLGLSKEELKTKASGLGADVPFFIDNKEAFATGIGEILNPIQINLNKYFLYLIKPPIHVSTPEAYAGVIPDKPTRSLHKDILLPIEEWKTVIKNDFEKSVFEKHPEIEEIKNLLYSKGAVYAAMSGSGSSVFGLFKEEPTFLVDPSYFVWKGKLK
ncbi:4-(cytidine 5'-diphospho)-2-C-methyl-D-erythritol kinase [Carboxylicivirga caseinilyticus]|uniref:4-(cytidine 5'-diphospho)-2-C-methyl-D-erythritol kinase n=1 Tax=Carboxylicivirga caseinilyticus TaxID=3417572 RepID=UPI003D33594B|nr:4-(cytidine 5'-diphospho)-2-C-methyl-D-erythritol kinase [Marinilabiliaceae bacterium A049]